MKPFNLSQYMYSLSQAAGAGLVGYSSGSSYAAGTVGAALQALGPAAGYTAGSVPFAGAGGALTQDNANFFWDGTNHRLGIGTTAPAYPLHVNGGAVDTYMRFTNSGKTAGVDVGIGNNGRAYLYNRNASDLVLGTSNGDRFVIDAAGHARIGPNVEPVSCTALLQLDGDISLFGAQSALMYNAYYAGGWYTAQAGYAASIKFDQSAGQLQFFTSSNSVASGASPSMSAAMWIDYAKNLSVFGQEIVVNNALLLQHDGSNGYIRTMNSPSTLYMGANNVTYICTNSTAFYPGSDGTYPCGWGTQRWSVVYAASGSINTSDAREKAWRGPLTQAETAAAKDLAREIGVYQWLAATETKGIDYARLHIGVTAQKVEEIMQANGLDPYRYGFFCYDEWDEHQRPADDGGMETVPAGNRFGVRYEELAMFILAGQKKAQDDLEARVAALEAKTP